MIYRTTKLAVASILFSLLISSPTAYADSDPFPGVAHMAEIPGTRVSGDQAIDCPTGSGRGIEVNATTGERASYCVKTWRSSDDLAAIAAYDNARTSAQAEALALSEAWNAAHPGQQKCFQWGPLTDPRGGTSSGGVCANPVSAPSGGIESSTLPAPIPDQETRTQTPAPVNTNGFGGYAVVHPDGHVCGVIVANSNDPFNNGGTMPQEYMGCPAGSRIIFQSAPSESGNVAGWHGPEVTYSNGQFQVGGSTDTITIANGIATNKSGESWNTGTGKPINSRILNVDPLPGLATYAEIPNTRVSSAPGASQSAFESSPVYTNRTPCPTGSQAAISVDMNFTSDPRDDIYSIYCVKTWIEKIIAIETQTISDTSVVVPAGVVPSSETSVVGVQSTSINQESQTAAPALDIVSAPNPEAEEQQMQISIRSKSQAVIRVSTSFEYTNLSVRIIKKGDKPITLNIRTNSYGSTNLTLKKNLLGATVSLYKNGILLDKDVVKVK